MVRRIDKFRAEGTDFAIRGRGNSRNIRLYARQSLGVTQDTPTLFGVDVMSGIHMLTVLHDNRSQKT